ncbi:MAG TPA: hypothetical protein VGB79_12940 [Allosphingosinicella sp.]
MNQLITWLEAHDKLAGWAQFLGAVIALTVTYVTAFAPMWRRRRQLDRAAMRILSNGYEVIESYARTSQKFIPFALSVRQASLTMASVADELSRFPVFELDGQGSNSIARRIVTMGLILRSLRLVLDDLAAKIEHRQATEEDQQNLKYVLDLQLRNARDLLTGAELRPPEWPGTDNEIATAQP